MNTQLGRLLTSFLVVAVFSAAQASAATVPAGFTAALVAGGLSNPMSMAVAPDGRIFVCLQGGQVRVIKDGALLTTPFVSLPVFATGEHGLLGVAFDPQFATNQYVYIHYTASSPTVRNRVSRFTATGDVAAPGSELVLIELDPLLNNLHDGGAIHFGPDGKLYVSTGDNGNGSQSQSLDNFFGKVLRLNPDGSIPADNPFYLSATGRYRAIWALGLRNPFTFSIHPATARMFINDVGGDLFEEINEGVAGANYGWPESEGPTQDPNHRGPFYYYGHGTGPDTGCAVTGGVFYEPAVAQFPQEYGGRYFFSDFCSGWIRMLDPATGGVAPFASGIPTPIDLRLAVDGALYYLVRGNTSNSGAVHRIQYTGSSAPAISEHPVSQTVPLGQPATFTVAASGTPPLGYQWQRNGANITGATAASYTIAAVGGGDNGAAFRCIVSNSAGTAVSNTAILTVSGNSAPVATITQPAAGTLYEGGMTIAYAGTGSDAEDGTLPASALTWQVDFHHDDHTHPFIPATSGATGGSFTIPQVGETSTNVWYRISLTVIDSQGLQTTSYRDVRPRVVTLKVATQRSGLRITIDGQPFTATYSFSAVVGMIRTIGAPSPQTASGGTYVFDSWSDGGAATHDIVVPRTATTYTARFRK